MKILINKHQHCKFYNAEYGGSYMNRDKAHGSFWMMGNLDHLHPVTLRNGQSNKLHELQLGESKLIH